MIDLIASYIKFTGNVHLLLVLSTDPMVFMHVSILDPVWNIPRWLQETLPLEPPFRFTKIWATAEKEEKTHDTPRNLTYIDTKTDGPWKIYFSLQIWLIFVGTPWYVIFWIYPHSQYSSGKNEKVLGLGFPILKM